MDKLTEQMEKVKEVEELLKDNINTVAMIKVTLDEEGIKAMAGSSPHALDKLDICGCEKEVIIEIVKKHADDLHNEISEYVESSLEKKKKEILDKVNNKSNNLGFDDIVALMKHLFD